MKQTAQDLKSMATQWPRIIAESLGLRGVEAPRLAAGSLPDRERWEASRFGAVWLGHATALLRLGCSTIITDPMLHERAGIDLGPLRIGRSRSTALPENVDEIPPVNVVLLSHAHLDHWCRVSLERFANPETVAVIPPKTRRLLPRGFGHVIELPPDQVLDLDDLHLTAMRPNHSGARYLIDAHRGCNAYLIEAEGAEHNRTLFAGDTARTDRFDVLAGRHPLDPERFGRTGVDLALFGIGGYYLPHHHATPEQVAEMARRMNAARLMPIHHGTFRGAKEPIDEPMERLLRVWDAERIVCAKVGEVWWGEG